MSIFSITDSRAKTLTVISSHIDERNMEILTKFNSQAIPCSFNAPLTIGQHSCKYFSANTKTGSKD